MTEHDEQAVNKESRYVTTRREQRRAAGKCLDCGKYEPREGSNSFCERCTSTRTAYQRRRRQERIKSQLCTECGRRADKVGNVRCKRCIEKAVERARQARKRNKETVISFLGGRCVECGIGDIRVLSVDHINGDGREHKRDLHKLATSSAIYADLCRKIKANKELGYDLQILCFNCHAIKDLEPCWY